MTDLFSCKCICGRYFTAFDMSQGVAVQAAKMHVQLDGEHKVFIQHKDSLSPCAFVSKSGMGSL